MREPVRSRERDTRSQKEILKEREMEEEEKEVKRAARKAEEKELIYQVRSNNSTNTSDCSIKTFIFSWRRGCGCGRRGRARRGRSTRKRARRRKRRARRLSGRWGILNIGSAHEQSFHIRRGNWRSSSRITTMRGTILSSTRGENCREDWQIGWLSVSSHSVCTSLTLDIYIQGAFF